MPLIIDRKRLIFFVHVPKTAGSSVEDYLLRRFGNLLLTDVNKRERVRGTGLITSITHLSAVDLREVIPDGAYVFAYVRDPLERALSEYRWQTGASRMSWLSFSTWLRVMARCVEIDARAYDNHIRPQTDLVPEGAEIFRLEDGFAPMIARLDAITGTTRPDIAMSHLKKRREMTKPTTVRRQDVALAKRLYAADYSRFGYLESDPSGYAPDPCAAVRDAVAALLAPAVMLKQRRDWLR